MHSNQNTVRKVWIFNVSTAALAMTVSAYGQANQTFNQPVLGVPGAVLTSHMSASTVLNLSISLAPSNKAGLEAMANAVSDRRNPNYHHFMTPAQIGEKFGPSVDTLNATLSFLKSKGMTVTLVADNRMAILFKGTASKVETAFSTKLNNYRSTSRTDGGPTTFFAYATAPKVPASLNTKIVSIGGLQSAFRPQAASLVTPDQLRKLYEVESLYNANASNRKGEGINIGITNYDGYLLSNVPKFLSQFGIPSPDGGPGSNITKVSINGSNGENVAAEGECDLDIQCVLSMAPKSHVYVYDNAGGFDPVSLLSKIANDNVVDIVTESWGENLADGLQSSLEAQHNQHVAMTLQGITYLACSGDTGVAWYGYPDIDPDVLVVGGSVATVASDGTRLDESGWDGSGSGWREYATSFNVTPEYQKNSIATLPIPNRNFRFFPDLGMHATGHNSLDPRDPRYTAPDPNYLGGYYWFTSGQLVSGSGTSASTPTLAGELGLILQDLIAQGAADLAPNGRYRLGRINDYLYKEVGNDPSVFFDILGGDTGLLPDNTEAVGVTGWDFVTGFGAPSATGLRDALLSQASIAIANVADAADIYTSTSPNITLGVNPEGGTEDLSDADGLGYSVQSVKQNGVGQVATAEVSFDLTGDAASRRSASLDVVASTPTGTTGFIYIAEAGVFPLKYDLVKTFTGSANSITLSTNLDLAKYVDGNSVHVLVRSMKPTRLGSSPFRLTVDKATVTERVPRN